ncbi:MAG: YlqD protein [uncultured archaeon A07HN63]|nr:MAG: YlqD protein [uncultured archaeon A07HN63]
MDISAWVQDRFGTDDTATLLDESVYGRKELRKDKTKLEQNLRQIENEMEKHGERYQKLLQKGAEAEEFRRKQYAQKAKFEKKKYEVKKKKHKANSIKLGTIISIEGMRDVLSMHNGDQESYELDRLMDEELNAQELQQQVMDQMAEFGLEIEDMKQVQEALDVEILDQELETGADEELELMREMEAGEVSEEQVDLNSAVENDELDDDFDDLDIDIEESEPSL